MLRPLGYVGIAGAFVVSKTIKIIVLGSILNKRCAGLFDSGTIPFLIKLSAAAFIALLSLRFLLGINNPDSLFHTFTFDLMLPGIGASLIFVGCSYLLRIEEFKALMSLLRYRKAAVSALYEETE